MNTTKCSKAQSPNSDDDENQRPHSFDSTFIYAPTRSIRVRRGPRLKSDSDKDLRNAPKQFEQHRRRVLPKDWWYSINAPSIAASSGGLMDPKRPRINIWPEWNDVDVNAEKWEAAHKGGKDKEKGKSPTVVTTQVFFDDPEGKIELPVSLKVDSWKRPQDLITSQQPVVVENEGVITEFDLVANNEHLHNSELMRNIICQIHALWTMSTVKPIQPDPPCEGLSPCEDMIYTWKPWEHIYSLCKAGKGPHLPMYNPYGKYIVRLYWMGCWRKLTVDDTIPIDDEGNILLPVSTLTHELWPLLLTKALIKVASLDYAGGNSNSEYGDFSILHCLSGRLPEAIPLQNMRPLPNYNATKPAYLYPEQMIEEFRMMVCEPLPACCEQRQQGGVVDGLVSVPSALPVLDENGHSHMNALWDLFKVCLPEWELPEQEWQKKEREAAMAEKDPANFSCEVIKEEKTEKESCPKDTKEKPESKTKEGKGKEKAGKESKDDKKKDKDKDKHKEKSPVEEIPIPDKPEVCVFGYYISAPRYPVKVSVLGDVADASEKLRQHGLCHLYPHPVWITQTRSISLEPPPPPENLPAWKLIRPRQKKPQISAEPVEQPATPKPIQCLELHSPFINHKVSAIPIPTHLRRPVSAIQRGLIHSREGLQDPIHEMEESVAFSPEGMRQNTPSVSGDDPVVIYSPPLSTIASECFDVAAAPTLKKEVDEELLREKEAEARELELELKEAKEKENKDAKDTSAKSDTKKIARKASKGSKGDGKEKHKDKEKDKEKEKQQDDDKSSKLPGQTNAPPPNSAVTSNKQSSSADGMQGGLSQHPGVDPMNQDDNSSHVSVGIEDEGPQKSKKMWMDYDIFYKSFKNVYLYHRPQTYPYRETFSDIKHHALPSTQSKDKKSMATSPGPVEERSPFFLFVDSLEPIEIIVSYSVISRWNEPHYASNILPPDEKKHSSFKLKEKDLDKEKELMTMTTSSVIDASSVREHTSQLTIPSGSLIAEPYCWKSLVTGQPILRLRTTGTRGAVLSLPIGRHVLRFLMSAPLGYHIHLCSTTKFVFGDEDTVMAELTKESFRFIDTAYRVMAGIGKCMQTFNDTVQFHQSCDELVNAHCPYRYNKMLSKQYHFTLFNDALYATLKKYLGDTVTPEVVFAWRAINFDATTKNILGNISGSRPGTSAAGTSHRGSGKPTSNKKQLTMEAEMERVENSWSGRDITAEEQVAAVKIQKVWKGHWVRKLRMARIAGNEENTKVVEQLQKCWAILGHTEDKVREHGLFLLRHMFRADPDIMPQYSFYKDEWNKISYSDYHGNHPEYPPHSWFIVFRDVFYVSEEMLVVPKLYCNIPTCLLRVVNNDTGEDMQRIFQKVAPHIFKQNKNGYTFVAEGRTTDIGQPSGKWRMRLIGSLSSLPAPSKPDITATFYPREIQDYYVPNDKNIIGRYAVKVMEDHMTSIQINTSKSDVYIKLMVLDRDEEVISCTGKGHVVVPAFVFLRNPLDDEKGDERRTSSRGSNRAGRSGSVAGKQNKRSTSGRSPDSRLSTLNEAGDDMEEKDSKPHKYVIQAVVLRNSWPLSESNWAFVQTLKDQEKNDLKVLNKTREQSPVKDKERPGAAAAQKPGKPIKGKEKVGKDGRQSRPISQNQYNGKPSYTLRLVSDAAYADDIEVKKDTERADEIRAMKHAWEEAEPGRAAKALQSRLNYLNTHMVSTQADIQDSLSTTESNGNVSGTKDSPMDRLPTPQSPGSIIENLEPEASVLSVFPPRPPTPTEVLQPLDITPFLKRCLGEPRYIDEAVHQKMLDEKQAEIQKFREAREYVEAWRHRDQAARKLAKKQQIEDYESLQTTLDLSRQLYQETLTHYYNNKIPRTTPSASTSPTHSSSP